VFVSRDQKLLKAGIFAMSVAIALTACAVALAATLGNEPELAIAAELAANVSTKEPAVRPDPYVKPRVKHVEHVELPPTVETTKAEPEPVKSEPLKPEPVKPEPVKPEVEPKSRREPAPEPAPHPKLQPRPEAKRPPETKAQPEPAPQPKLKARPDPQAVSPPERELGPRRLARANAPKPLVEERQKPSELRSFELPPGAVMNLTIKALGMLSLQTCTPIPTFEKRLIVRADRV
jgi:outer membrane biosynthesis protein TonB